MNTFDMEEREREKPTHPATGMLVVAGTVATKVRAPAAPPTDPPLVSTIVPPVVGHVAPNDKVMTSPVVSPRPVTVTCSLAVSDSMVAGENESPAPAAENVSLSALTDGTHTQQRQRTDSELAGRHGHHGSAAAKHDAAGVTTSTGSGTSTTS